MWAYTYFCSREGRIRPMTWDTCCRCWWFVDMSPHLSVGSLAYTFNTQARHTLTCIVVYYTALPDTNSAIRWTGNNGICLSFNGMCTHTGNGLHCSCMTLQRSRIDPLYKHISSHSKLSYTTSTHLAIRIDFPNFGCIICRTRHQCNIFDICFMT